MPRKNPIKKGFNQKSKENLIRAKKGQPSINPLGRPKGVKVNKTIFKNMLYQKIPDNLKIPYLPYNPNIELWYEAFEIDIFNLARRGNAKAIDKVFQYGFDEKIVSSNDSNESTVIILPEKDIDVQEEKIVSIDDSI